MSPAVVSYVINDGPRPVAAGTRQRVLAAIESVGYKPDVIARALASGATAAYGLIVPDIANPFFAALAHAIEDATSAAGRVVLLGDSAESKAREGELMETFLARRVDGLFFVGVDSCPDLSTLTGNGIPVVVLDRAGPQQSGVSSITIDNVGAARTVTEHLLGHGYTRIGITVGPSHLFTAVDRLEGWRRALTEAGVEPDPRWIVEAPFTRSGGLGAGRFLLDAEDRPEAVFASNEQQAIGVLVAAAEAGLRVPEDLALMSFDSTEASEYCVPRLSGVAQPLTQIARMAIEILDRAVDVSPGEHPTSHLISDHEFHIRSSCGPHDDSR